MPKLVPVAIFCLLCLQGFAQIDVTITTPGKPFQHPNPYNDYPYALAADSLQIIATVNSTYELTSVIASIGNHQTSLVSEPNQQGYKGTISLEGLHEGDYYQLIVKATDYLNNTKSDTTTVMYDKRPEAFILSPLTATVIKNTLALQLKCVDIDTCTFSITYPEDRTDGGNLVYSGKIKDSLKLNLDFSRFNSRYGILTIHAKDKKGQENFNSGFIELGVVDDPLLTEYYVNNTFIHDFNYHELLGRGDSSVSYSSYIPGHTFAFPQLTDITNNKYQTIPVKVEVYDPHVTSYGAIFTGLDSASEENGNTTDLSVYDWNEGVLYPLGKGRGIRVAGQFATFLYNTGNSNELHLRNLMTKSDVIIASNPYDMGDVDSTGAVVFSSIDPATESGYNIYRYKNGETTLITNDATGINNLSPRTDGKNIVYYKNRKDSIFTYVYNGAVNIRLAGFKSNSYNSGFLVNNRFIAYKKNDALGNPQVWLRDSSGNEKQLTFYNVGSDLLTLTPAGDVIYKGPDGVQLRLNNGKIVNINTGIPVYRNGSFYNVIGRSLFKLNLDEVLALKLTSFTIEKNGNKALLQWTAGQDGNRYTEIERSEDAIHYVTIGSIPGGGKTGLINSDFIDDKPLGGYNYYRLKFVQQNGFDYSPVRVIRNDATWSLQLYPNPVSDNLTLQCTSDKKIDVTLEVWSSEGKKVATSTMHLAKGTTFKNIPVSHLKKGSYFLRAGTLSKDNIDLKFLKL